MTRHTRYTVKQLSDLTGVTIRTLRYYDEIGLLTPAAHGANGYRYYGRDELLRLQQILFYRALRCPLDDIARLLAAPHFDRAAALRQHRARLAADLEAGRRMIATIDRTLREMEGGAPMSDEDLFDGLDTPEQRAHEAWLVDRYGADTSRHVAESRRRVGGWSKAEWARTMAEAEALNGELAAALVRGAAVGSPEVQALVARHFAWVSRFWTPDRTAYAGLGQLYREEPGFRAFYARSGQPGLADFLADAIQVYAATLPG